MTGLGRAPQKKIVFDLFLHTWLKIYYGYQKRQVFRVYSAGKQDGYLCQKSVLSKFT